MTYSRAVVERAGELRRSGLSCREIARELGGPSKSAVARWTRAVASGGAVGRAVAKMDLPKVVGDGPVYPDIDPDDKDALIERLVLENAVLRAVNDVLKAASLDGLSNREKTLVIDRLRPAGKWSLRELTSFLGISKSSYEYQRTAIARPDRLAPLRALVRRVFAEDGEGARGYRFVTARLRELDEPVRASEKVVLRIMREEGLVPRWMRRKRRPYSSYAGEPTPAPPNLVRRDFRSALPNFLWLTDITEFRLPSGRKVYLSAIRDCFDSSVVAWRAGERPDAALANSTLEDACALLGLATLMWTVPGGAQETGGPYMRDPRHPRHFTDEFKRQIVDLYNAGKPKREIMDEYDLGKSTVERWIKSINATGSPRAACNRTPEQNRILELERENRRLRMEVDVLKQAALIYARK